jgi:hypothetical protein
MPKCLFIKALYHLYYKWFPKYPQPNSIDPAGRRERPNVKKTVWQAVLAKEPDCREGNFRHMKWGIECLKQGLQSNPAGLGLAVSLNIALSKPTSCRLKLVAAGEH